MFALVSNGPRSCPLSTTPCSRRHSIHVPFMLGCADVSFTLEQADSLVRHSRTPPRIRCGRYRSAASGGEPGHLGCRHTGGHRLPDAAGTPADCSTRRRAARVRARRDQRGECQIRQRNRAAVRSASRRGRGRPVRGACPRARGTSARPGHVTSLRCSDGPASARILTFTPSTLVLIKAALTSRLNLRWTCRDRPRRTGGDVRYVSPMAWSVLVPPTRWLRGAAWRWSASAAHLARQAARRCGGGAGHARDVRSRPAGHDSMIERERQWPSVNCTPAATARRR